MKEYSYICFMKTIVLLKHTTHLAGLWKCQDCQIKMHKEKNKEK